MKNKLTVLLALFCLAAMLLGMVPAFAAPTSASPPPSPTPDIVDIVPLDNDGDDNGDDVEENADDQANAEENTDDADGEDALPGRPADLAADLTYEVLQEEFSIVSKRGELELWWNIADHNIAVVQKWNNKIWTAFPYNYQNDKQAGGELKNDLRSHLQIGMLSRAGKPDTKRSYTDSLARQVPEDLRSPNADFEFIYPEGWDENAPANPEICLGIRFIYYFPMARVRVPIEYRLEADFLRLVIPTDEIQDDNTFIVMTDVCPARYFGAGSTGMDGYAFIPDGCGAIMAYNSGLINYADYARQIYDPDRAKNIMRSEVSMEDMMLPVFGQRHVNPETGQEDAFVAIIDAGASVGTLEAIQSGKYTSYNTVSVRFKVRPQDTYTLISSTGAGVDLSMTRPGYLTGGRVEMRYCFLKGDTTWVGMAHRYAEYLQEKGMKPLPADASKTPLYADIYGAVTKTVPVMGFQTKRNVPLTSYADVRTITQGLKEDGIDSPVIRHMSWSKSGNNGRIQDAVRPERTLGGKKAYNELLQWMEDNGIPFYPDFDLVNVTSSGYGFSRSKSAARAISGPATLQKYFVPSTMLKVSRQGKYNNSSWVLASPFGHQERIDKLSRSLESFGQSNISLGTFTSILYSDGSPSNLITRDETETIVAGALGNLQQNGFSTMGSAGRGAALAGVDHMLDLTNRSSRFYVFTYDVPFYQTVLRGYVQYSTPSLNLLPSPREAFLLGLESGSALKFSFIQEGNWLVKETPMDWLCAANFDDWRSDAADYYKEWKQIFGVIGNSRIVKHEVNPENTSLRAVTYESGHTVLINHGVTDGVINGQTVKAQGYVLKEAE
ncbi:MAG: DUF5696 domain-containing protein [Clostridia bacterium]|nr:DUF5696 domain-containing protein [Clostridia bacterium]